MSELYSEIIKSKTSLQIPVFFDGRPMHSKYNPVQEGMTFAGQVKEYSGFIVVLGIGGGYHIKSISERFPEAHILAIETSADDLNFLKNIQCIQDLQKNKKITFAACEEKSEISRLLTSLYIPAFHGNLSICVHRAWAEHLPEKTKLLTKYIQQILSEISADYSVQAHFGKIWQHNIMQNLYFFSEYSKKHSDCFQITQNFPTEKTAAVIAAGPSLDSSIEELKLNRKNYYIISTDTALNSLLRNRIIPDAVISIDGQNVSHTHFMFTKKELELNFFAKTLFIFDLCSNPDSVRQILNNGSKILFTRNSHPLSAIAGNFLKIQSGSGTVTIAACDFARKAGFSKIKTFAADFSYFSGKAYAKGTYLEQNFNGNSCRLNSGEQQYDTLMFRTPLILKDIRKKIYTTEVLESYRKTFEQWQSDSSNKAACICEISNPKDFSFGDFFKKLISTQNNANGNFSALLPYIAFLRKDKSFQNKDFSELLKLAQSTLLQYNSWI